MGRNRACQLFENEPDVNVVPLDAQQRQTLLQTSLFWQVAFILSLETIDNRVTLSCNSSFAFLFSPKDTHFEPFTGISNYRLFFQRKSKQVSGASPSSTTTLWRNIWYSTLRSRLFYMFQNNLQTNCLIYYVILHIQDI